VLLQPIVELLIPQTGQRGRRPEADLVGMVKAGGEEEVAGAFAERLAMF
jgi:hypothetical protein